MFLTPLQVAQTAYLWRFGGDCCSVEERPADLAVAFEWLLQLQAGTAAAALLQARTGYVAALHATRPDLDAEIAAPAALHQDLVGAELDRAARAAPMPAATAAASRCHWRDPAHDAFGRTTT